MVRTQIHLSEDEVELLDRERARSGASRSELIRRAIKRTYGREPEFALPRSIGIVSDGRWSSATVDEELAGIYEERSKRRHG